MELRQLRYFVKAKELQNFTEAATQLYISQSTLSQQIKQLEDELGIPLFNRVGKHIFVTEAGELFYDYALQCIQKANDGLQVLKDLGDMATGHLTVGATFGVRHILTPAVVGFHKKYPHISIEVIFGTSKELTDRLAKFEMDFVLTFEEVVNRQEMKYQPLFESDLVFVVHRGSALAGKKSITLKEIQSMNLALPAAGFITRRFVDEVFAENELDLPVNLAINDIPTLIELVATGNWTTILTETTVEHHKNLVAVPIRGVKSTQQAAIISLEDVYEKQSVKAFFEIIKSII